MEEKYSRFYNKKGQLKAAWIKAENVLFIGDTNDEAVALIHLNDGTKMEIYSSDISGYAEGIETYAEGLIVNSLANPSGKRKGYFGVCGYNILNP